MLMQKKRRPEGRGAQLAAMLISVALASSAVTALVCSLFFTKGETAPLVQMAAIIKNSYYYFDREVKNDAVLIDAALRGMVSALHDDYAAYYTAEEYAEQQRSTSGEYSGIGIVVGEPDDSGTAIIQHVYDGSPMDEAGAQAGDRIVKINGTDVEGLTLDELLALFHADGSEDTLFLRRDGTEFSVSVLRAVINVPYATYRMLENGIGYICITGFYGHVIDEVRTAIASLQEQCAAALVLDLRDNPGGSLTDVLGVADLFLKKGDRIVTIKSRNETQEVYDAEDDYACELPIVILVNGNSASAAELLTGALQDHGLATVVGTQTFGKGIVQSYYQLSSNDGWIKLTTDAYFTPKDVCIHGSGIQPDIAVDLPQEYVSVPLAALPQEADTQLSAAVTCLTKTLEGIE